MNEQHRLARQQRRMGLVPSVGTGKRKESCTRENERGIALQMEGKFEEAEACYRRALQLNPDAVDVWSNLGAALHKQGRMQEAIEHHERAIALDGSAHFAYSNLGSALTEAGRLEEALACFRKVLRLHTGNAVDHVNLATTLASLGQREAAAAQYREGLKAYPQDPVLHFNLGLTHLLQGDLLTGWPAWEHRYLAAGQPRMQFAQPRWQGEPLAGRRILLYHEQGLGDTLQFVRYVPLVQAAGGRVILLVQPSLQRLIPEVLGAGEMGDGFDVHCPLPSLPVAFGTTLETIPARVPYVVVPEAERRLAAARAWPNEGLRVGLVWGGNPAMPRDRLRSIPLAACEPILRVEGVSFFSLQAGPAAAGIRSGEYGLGELDLDLDNMADTAAKMQHLDLVITVCTGMAHLAGALGLPLWVMLDQGSDWRWLLDRDDSPWYPTARLFRQRRWGEWGSVVSEVACALTALRDQRAGAARPGTRLQQTARAGAGDVSRGQAATLACSVPESS